jgi:fructose-1,6-bisphosphatase I
VESLSRGLPPRRSSAELSGTSVVTIERHILEEGRLHDHATGAFSSLLYDIALAAKIISKKVNMAGLVDIIGRAGGKNVQGEVVQKLDVFAQEVIYNSMDHAGHLCCMVSEESEDVIPIPPEFPTGPYVFLFDPLDGSSNIDVNVSIGTIFSIHRQRSTGPRGTVEDCLQQGKRQLAAGYVLYGSSTMLVYTSGHGVHGFTLDPTIGEFVLSHPNMRMPAGLKSYYSVNEAYASRWMPGQRRLVEHLKARGHGLRYIGSLVADFHRTLLRGGLFMYPSDSRSPEGKLRLLYEAAPLALIAEEAGGRASDGGMNILELEPDGLHQRTPLYLGSAELVSLAEEFLAQEEPAPTPA